MAATLQPPGPAPLGVQVREAPRCGEGPPGLARQLRVLLTPLAPPGPGLPPPAQERLPGAAAGPPRPGKRSRPQSPGGGRRDAESDGGDSGDEADRCSQLSAYERKRLKNIMENAKFFAALNLPKLATRFEGIATKREAAASKRAKPKRTKNNGVLRRSMRLQRVKQRVVRKQKPVAQPKLIYPEVPDRPLPMDPENLEGSGALREDLLDTWMRISEVKAEEAGEHPQDMERYQESLRRMLLREENVRKVVKTRVCSVAIHPATSSLLVAAGDTIGHVGLWNVDCGSAGAAQTYTVHNHMVSCMHFSPCNPAHLLTLGSDGLRCGDVTRAVFDQVFRAKESSSFDFLEASASTAIVGHWEGSVAVVDRRTRRTTSELSVDIGFKRTRTVHVHPVNRQYFLAAGSVDVCVFDVRYLKASENQPVSCLPGHTRSVASAYFSPMTGNRVVTLSADDQLRVFDTSSAASTAALHCAISHNNNTGRWLTCFRAVWEPKRDDCFVVGSMLQPRRIEVFRDSGQLLHCFSSPDCLASVCCINALHPHRNVLVGGNASGRLFVFQD